MGLKLRWSFLCIWIVMAAASVSMGNVQKRCNKCSASNKCVKTDGSCDCECPVKTEFKCKKNGICNCEEVSKRCNTEANCDGGLDEKNCEDYTCTAGYWKCDDNLQCIDSDRKCDNNNDCNDTSDESEENCGDAACNIGEFKCTITGICISQKDKCDSNDDCSSTGKDRVRDTSDENCNKTYGEKCDDVKECNKSRGLQCNNRDMCACNSTRFYNSTMQSCVPKKTYGAACGVSDECDDDRHLVCNISKKCGCSDTNFFNSNKNTCNPKKSNGASCSSSTECNSTRGLECSNAGKCACKDNHNNVFNSNTNKCEPKKAHGANCEKSIECSSTLGLECIARMCSCKDNTKKNFNIHTNRCEAIVTVEHLKKLLVHELLNMTLEDLKTLLNNTNNIPTFDDNRTMEYKAEIKANNNGTLTLEIILDAIRKVNSRKDAPVGPATSGVTTGNDGAPTPTDAPEDSMDDELILGLGVGAIVILLAACGWFFRPIVECFKRLQTRWCFRRCCCRKATSLEQEVDSRKTEAKSDAESGRTGSTDSGESNDAPSSAGSPPRDDGDDVSNDGASAVSTNDVASNDVASNVGSSDDASSVASNRSNGSLD